MGRAQMSITTKPMRSFPPVNVQIILTGTKEMWDFNDDHISGDPNANKVSVRHHLKINELQAFWKSIVSLVYSTVGVGVCVCLQSCRCEVEKLKLFPGVEAGWERGESVSRLREVWWRTLGSVGRKRAGELIKAGFVDVMRGRPPSCWLPMTQWSTESLPHPLPQEGASPYAGARWQWLAEEHPLLLWRINVKCVHYSHSYRTEWMGPVIVTVSYLL